MTGAAWYAVGSLACLLGVMGVALWAANGLRREREAEQDDHATRPHKGWL